MRLVNILPISLIYCLTIIQRVHSANTKKEHSNSDEDEAIKIWVDDIFGLKLLSPKRLAKGYNPDLEPCGYVFSMDNQMNPPSKIKIDDLELRIPNGAKHLLVTLPESRQGKYRQDVQIMGFPGIKQPEFEDIELSDSLVAIYVQYKKTPNTASHGATKKEEERIKESKEEEEGKSSKNPRKGSRLSRRYKGRSRKLTEKKKQDEVIAKIRNLFTQNTSDKSIWPAIQYGVVSAENISDAKVQEVQNLPSDRSNIRKRYFILQFFPNFYHFVKVQNKIISLNAVLEEACRANNPLIKLDIKVDGFDRLKNDAPIIIRGSKTRMSLVRGCKADESQFDKLGVDPAQLGPTRFILLLSFKQIKLIGDSDIEVCEGDMNSPRPRRHTMPHKLL